MGGSGVQKANASEDNKKETEKNKGATQERLR
jgi:hypothetical protein